MSIIKKKVALNQFIFELIKFQFEFIENNFDKIILLADEFKVLSEKDKDEYVAKAYDLLIADISLGCKQHFYKIVSSEEIEQIVSVVYGLYLVDYLKLSGQIESQKTNDVLKLLELTKKTKEDVKKQNKKNPEAGNKKISKFYDEVDKQKFYLCRAFSIYCAGNNMKSKNWEGKSFAAFKFAMGIIKADIVSSMLKKFKVIW